VKASEDHFIERHLKQRTDNEVGLTK